MIMLRINDTTGEARVIEAVDKPTDITPREVSRFIAKQMAANVQLQAVLAEIVRKGGGKIEQPQIPLLPVQ